MVRFLVTAAMSTTVHLFHNNDSSLASLRTSFQTDGFVVFPNAIEPSVVLTLQSRLDGVLRGEYNRSSPPDKVPTGRFCTNDIRVDVGEVDNDGSLSSSSLISPLTTGIRNEVSDWNNYISQVLQIINIHKSDRDFRQLATSPDIGRMVAELAGWKYGARLAQDQVWAKPPGAPPLVFHRDFPYFMFTPNDVVTVWIALDDMDAELGPLEYVRGSHKWGDGRVGSASSFFHDANKRLLYSAARLEGIECPETMLDIVSMAGLKAGGLSIHNGKLWHGSGKNLSKDRPRRGVGLHYIPGEATFTKKARVSKLWRRYVPETVADEDLPCMKLCEETFPLVYSTTPGYEIGLRE